MEWICLKNICSIFCTFSTEFFPFSIPKGLQTEKKKQNPQESVYPKLINLQNSAYSTPIIYVLHIAGYVKTKCIWKIAALIHLKSKPIRKSTLAQNTKKMRNEYSNSGKMLIWKITKFPFIRYRKIVSIEIIKILQ